MRPPKGLSQKWLLSEVVAIEKGYPPERLYLILTLKKRYRNQCPKLRVHPAPGVHISTAGCTILGGVHPVCARFLTHSRPRMPQGSPGQGQGMLQGILFKVFDIHSRFL